MQEPVKKGTVIKNTFPKKSYPHMFKLSVLVILSFLITNVKGGNSVSHTGVKGDQTVGGIHLFGIHSPSGTGTCLSSKGAARLQTGEKTCHSLHYLFRQRLPDQTSGETATMCAKGFAMVDYKMPGLVYGHLFAGGCPSGKI